MNPPKQIMTHYVILSVNQVLSIILNMSCLQNEAILENIFDEILEKCYQRNLHLLFGEKELEEHAATLTKERWERLYD